LGSTYETNYGQLRLTFYINSVSANNTASLPTLYDIRLLGDAQWFAPAHPLAKNNHMYTYDVLENVTFPNTVAASAYRIKYNNSVVATLTSS
jgi:hypothetical protein